MGVGALQACRIADYNFLLPSSLSLSLSLSLYVCLCLSYTHSVEEVVKKQTSKQTSLKQKHTHIHVHTRSVEEKRALVNALRAEYDGHDREELTTEEEEDVQAKLKGKGKRAAAGNQVGCRVGLCVW